MDFQKYNIKEKKKKKAGKKRKKSKSQELLKSNNNNCKKIDIVLALEIWSFLVLFCFGLVWFWKVIVGYKNKN